MKQFGTLTLSFALLACGADRSSSEPPPASNEIRVLVFTRALEAQHDPAPVRAFFGALPASTGIRAEVTDDASRFSDNGLSAFDVVAFVNTSGDVLNDAQQAAFERYMQRGHGFVGVHAAADTEHGWPFYGALLGAAALSHGEPSELEVKVEEDTHPSVTQFGASASWTDAWYDFDRNPRESATVVLKSGAGLGDRPLSWYQYYGGGRAFYTSLGHASESWLDARFQSHLLGAFTWAARGGNFGRAVLTRALRSPIALAVRPDEDVYFIERTGEVKLLHAKSGVVVSALTLAVDTAQENGLLGLALDPDFAANRFVYLYYSAPLVDDPTRTGPPGINRLSRFTARADGTLAEDSGLTLLEVPSERRCCHEGGALAFAADKTLLLTTGDNTNPFDSAGTAPIDRRPSRETFNAERTAGNPFDLRGKVLRIARDGSIPAGNLFDGNDGRAEIYAMGLRNPYRLAVDSSDGRIFVSDVGPDAADDTARGPRGYDEINLVTNGNYGWPHCIGERLPYAAFDFDSGALGEPFDCSATRAPVLAYDYGTMTYPALGRGFGADGSWIGRAAIAGAVYRPRALASFALPARFQGKLLMADWARSVIASVDTDASGKLARIERLWPGERFQRPIAFDVGPDGAVYVLEYGSNFWGDNTDAALSRVEYGEYGKLSPVGVSSASVANGPAGSVVRFSAKGSRALSPRESLVDYAWDFDADGHVDAHGVDVEHRFDVSGGYSVSLRVQSSSGAWSRPIVTPLVIGNSPPEVHILTPSRGTRLARGVAVQLVGEGSDPEDGVAPCSELSWNVSLIHNTHAHPVATLSGCSTTFLPDVAGHEEQGLLSYALELVYTDHGGRGGEPALTDREAIQFDVEVR